MATAEQLERRAARKTEMEADYAEMAKKYGTEVECGILCTSAGHWTTRFYIAKENYSRWMKLMREAHELVLETVAIPPEDSINKPILVTKAG